MPVTNITEGELPDLFAKGDLTLVYFWSYTCGYCRAVGPTVERLAERFVDQMTVVKLNISENPGADRHFGLPGVPVLLIYKDGVEVDRIVGAQTEAKIAAIIEPFLPTDGAARPEPYETKLQRRAG